ncbi:hypothetical protein PPL_11447 [Heterostelium album PN500]|uniref:Uncharacterized protein n=1 Tax=Heterostelium pallidum (strain ATCC 26659 / Pp 5 / PN500) TaxID=670386 RepID=D3BTF3_HETP5|nr:hypothetical protein PPL_11447 [Heterostelium album PN500]EFA75370.1 hypothetical protein PPL_11447 [Heterostelium album PN500]|eukprot:XP_020427504.1 hypothetical protein PPL_11447 [Heterostelium album PN500]
MKYQNIILVLAVLVALCGVCSRAIAVKEQDRKVGDTGTYTIIEYYSQDGCDENDYVSNQSWLNKSCQQGVYYFCTPNDDTIFKYTFPTQYCDNGAPIIESIKAGCNGNVSYSCYH